MCSRSANVIKPKICQYLVGFQPESSVGEQTPKSARGLSKHKVEMEAVSGICDKWEIHFPPIYLERPASCYGHGRAARSGHE